MIWMPPIGPGNPSRSAGWACKAPGAEILKGGLANGHGRGGPDKPLFGVWDAPAAKGKTSFSRVARLRATQRKPPFGLWRACLRTAEPSALKNLHWACGAPAPVPSSKPLSAVPRACGLHAAQPSGKPLLGVRGARCLASDNPLMGVRRARSLLAAQPSGKPSLGARGARSLRAAQPSNKPL